MMLLTCKGTVSHLQRDSCDSDSSHRGLLVFKGDNESMDVSSIQTPLPLRDGMLVELGMCSTSQDEYVHVLSPCDTSDLSARCQKWS